MRSKKVSFVKIVLVYYIAKVLDGFGVIAFDEFLFALIKIVGFVLGNSRGGAQ